MVSVISSVLLTKTRNLLKSAPSSRFVIDQIHGKSSLVISGYPVRQSVLAAFVPVISNPIAVSAARVNFVEIVI